MRKKNKALFIFLTILAVLAVAGTGIFLYLTPDSTAKAQYKEDASVLAQEITDKNLSRMDTAITENVFNSSGTTDGTGQQGDDGNGKAAAVIGVIGTLTDAEKKELEGKLTVVYDQIMIDMQDDAMALVNQLVEQAKVDYKKLKSEKNNNPASLSKLAVEYMNRGDALEEQMDNSFKSVTDVMKEQMTGLGIDPAPIISNYEKSYAQIKEQRQKTLIDKALKVIKK